VLDRSSPLAKAQADVAAARKPMTTFTGPKTSPGPVPSGKSVVSIYSVQSVSDPAQSTGVCGKAQAKLCFVWKTQFDFAKA